MPAINESVDDLLIYAEVVPIDGVGGTLGSAGPCWIRLANGLTALGTMKFDEADFDDLEATGNLSYVILHEIGHIIGIGTLSEWFTITQDEGGADPYFPGAEAVTRYDAAGGLAVNKFPWQTRAARARATGTGARRIWAAS